MPKQKTLFDCGAKRVNSNQTLGELAKEQSQQIAIESRSRNNRLFSNDFLDKIVSSSGFSQKIVKDENGNDQKLVSKIDVDQLKKDINTSSVEGRANAILSTLGYSTGVEISDFYEETGVDVCL
eukprot:g933.t1